MLELGLAIQRPAPVLSLVPCTFGHRTAPPRCGSPRSRRRPPRPRPPPSAAPGPRATRSRPKSEPLRRPRLGFGFCMHRPPDPPLCRPGYCMSAACCTSAHKLVSHAQCRGAPPHPLALLLACWATTGCGRVYAACARACSSPHSSLACAEPWHTCVILLLCRHTHTRRYAFTNFDRCSLANIQAQSPKMWAHLISIYVITFIVLKVRLGLLSDAFYSAVVWVAARGKLSSACVCVVRQVGVVSRCGASALATTEVGRAASGCVPLLSCCCTALVPLMYRNHTTVVPLLYHCRRRCGGTTVRPRCCASRSWPTRRAGGPPTRSSSPTVRAGFMLLLGLWRMRIIDSSNMSTSTG